MKEFVSLLVCVILALAVGCATQSAQQKGSDMPNPHAGVFAEKCAKCHDLAKVDDAHQTKTKVEMREILQRMKDKPDSGISDEDYEELLLYY